MQHIVQGNNWCALQVLKEGNDEGDPLAICGRAQKRFSEEQSHHAR